MAAWIEGLSERIGQAVAWLTIAMVVLTCLIVLLRYGFDQGAIALQEAVLYLHAMAFLLGAGYTLKHDGHVRVDIFYQQMSPRGRAWVDLLGTVVLLLPSCGFIIWVSLDYVISSWRILEGSREAGGLPLVFMLKTLIPLSCFALALQGVAMASRRWRELKA